MPSLPEWLQENAHYFSLIEDAEDYGETGRTLYKEVNLYGVETLINAYLAQLKVWIFEPRSAEPEVHLRIETVLEDMQDDIAYAESHGWEWDFRGDIYPSIYVDDGGSARQVGIRP